MSLQKGSRIQSNLSPPQNIKFRSSRLTQNMNLAPDGPIRICTNIKKVLHNNKTDTASPNTNMDRYICIGYLSNNPRIYTHEGAEGSVTSILVGISTLNPSAAVDIIIPGICGCQCSSFKSF